MEPVVAHHNGDAGVFAPQLEGHLGRRTAPADHDHVVIGIEVRFGIGVGDMRQVFPWYMQGPRIVIKARPDHHVPRVPRVRAVENVPRLHAEQIVFLLDPGHRPIGIDLEVVVAGEGPAILEVFAPSGVLFLGQQRKAG